MKPKWITHGRLMIEVCTNEHGQDIVMVYARDDSKLESITASRRKSGPVTVVAVKAHPLNARGLAR